MNRKFFVMVQRALKGKIRDRFHKGRALILIGPRQVGKTTLIKELLKGEDHLFLDGDDPSIRALLTDPNTEQLRNIIGLHTLVFIDEAQRIENIGLTLKIVTDQFPQVQLLVSGSSAFELNSAMNEPLTGRKWDYKLYPISWSELEKSAGFVSGQQQLELRLIYGMYPEVITNPGQEVPILTELSNSYLFKDILALGGIRKPQVLERMVRALALQMGNEVSYNELAQLVGVDKNTVSDYIDLLEQAFVIFRLGSFSRNLRNEIKRNQKIYFYDTGIRNAVIGNFSSLENRMDVGVLWECFLIGERIRANSYNDRLVQGYFWRTVSQQEIDYVEEGSGSIAAFEFKWSSNNRVRFPKKFLESYGASSKVIHKGNFREFLFL